MKRANTYKWARLSADRRSGKHINYRQAVELSLKMWTVIAARGTSPKNERNIIRELFGEVWIHDDCWLCDFFHRNQTAINPQYTGVERCKCCPISMSGSCCFNPGSLWNQYLYTDNIPARFAAARGIRDILKEELDRLNKEQPE